MEYSRIFRLIYLSIYYSLIFLISLCNLLMIALYMRHYYWVIIGYYEPFVKESVFSFLDIKGVGYILFYWGIKLFLLILPTILSLFYKNTKKWLSLLLSLVPCGIALLFHYDDMWWKWINDNIYDFGFYLM